MAEELTASPRSPPTFLECDIEAGQALLKHPRLVASVSLGLGHHRFFCLGRIGPLHLASQSPLEMSDLKGCRVSRSGLASGNLSKLNLELGCLSSCSFKVDLMKSGGLSPGQVGDLTDLRL